MAESNRARGMDFISHLRRSSQSKNLRNSVMNCHNLITDIPALHYREISRLHTLKEFYRRLRFDTNLIKQSLRPDSLPFNSR